MSGRALESLSADERRALRPPRPVERITPMKAVLTDRRFSDPEWLFERKLDGVRCLVARTSERVRIRSRTGKQLNRAYPELVEALEADPCADFIADGEIVAFAGGLTSFSRLQGRMQISDPERARRSGIAVHLYVFDLLRLDRRDTTQLPLRARKRLLRDALSFAGPVRYAAHRNTDGEALFEDACRRGLEGLIAKRAASAYAEKRSGDWLKLKCSAGQELVIGGFTEPQGQRTDFGALLVGYHEDGALRYAGKVGTGFDRRTLSDLGRRLRGLERSDPPFEAVEPRPGGARWVEPELVGEFEFTEWTRDGRLRHPRYLGLRDDKDAREVIRESRT